MAEIRNFQAIEIPDDLPEDLQPQRKDRAAEFAASAISLALKSLSQRAIAATRDVFTLLSCASCFWLWNNIPDPSNTQIMSLSLYAVFILIANVIVRRF